MDSQIYDEAGEINTLDLFSESDSSKQLTKQ